MLEDLAIKNLAVVEKARIRPAAGMTVITGSTGGGKSLIVTALKLLRGGKAAAALVRRGAERAVVDGSFRLSRGERSDSLRAAAVRILGEEPEEDLVVLSRVVEASGRSRAYACGRPITVGQLRQLGSLLIEVHGQGESAMLCRPQAQAEMVDQFGGLEEERKAFAAALDRARDLARELEERARGEGERRDRIDLLSFQLDQIRRVAPEPGELSRLEERRSVLANLERLRELLDGAGRELSQEEACITERLGRVLSRLEEAARFDRRAAEPLEALGEAEELLREAGGRVLSHLHSLDEGGDRLDTIEERIHGIRTLCNRFGVEESGLEELARRFEEELDRLRELDEGAGTLTGEAAAALTRAAEAGRRLAAKRGRAGGKLCRALADDLARMGMGSAKVGLVQEPLPDHRLLAEATPWGAGRVEFLLRANPGEKELPLARVASGGERARVMLALKKRLADADTVPLLVLDEIDAEVGGRLGGAIGRELKEVALSHQVICVTHLPQVAAYGDEQVVVEKGVERGRTFARVRSVVGRERDRELAAMSRGGPPEEGEIRRARQLRREAGGEPA